MPAASASAKTKTPSARRPIWPMIALLVAGAALFSVNQDVVGGSLHGRPVQYVFVLLVAAVALIPPVNRVLQAVFEKLRMPKPRTRWITAAVIFVVTVKYFLLSAELAGRGLFPTYHDEFMYLLQARMLAHGRLWMPGHPLGEFFDSFFIITRPVYAGAYFPGTALLNVPGIWLGLAPASTAAIIAGLIVMMLYLVMTEMIDGVAGLLAALLAVSLEQLRVVAVMTMSHSAMTLMLLLTLWAYLHWRRGRRIGWAVAVGVFAGWGAITRPLDAVALIGPVGVAMLWEMRQMPLKRGLLALGMVIVGALPLLSLQLILDKGVTGHWLKTPITVYGQANFPGLEFGFHPYTPAESPSPLPQVRDYYRDFLAPMLRKHAEDGFWRTWLQWRWMPSLDIGLPAHLLMVLLPLGLLGVLMRQLALVAGVVLFPLVFAFYPTFLNHYALACAPGYILLVLLAGDVLRQRFSIAGPAFVMGVAVLAISAIPEVRGTHDPFMQAPSLAHINGTLAELEHTPAVVLFRYASGRADVHEEPVFNIDAPWPDDAPIIRAHDLGVRNVEIYKYFSNKEPQRFFYGYNRATGELTQLGLAKDLANSK